MTDLEACAFAAEMVRGAGFEFAYASMKSEACYYRWSDETDLLRIAAHKHDRGVAGLGKIIARITFPAPNPNSLVPPIYSEIHVTNTVASAIGHYILRNRSVIAYTGRQPRRTRAAA